MLHHSARWQQKSPQKEPRLPRGGGAVVVGLLVALVGRVVVGLVRQDASLVICHAGVGTVMETLRLKKQAVVVVNPSLMDNHQLEVAEALEEDNHIHLCRAPSMLHKVVAKIPSKGKPLQTIPMLDTTLFPSLINEELSMIQRSSITLCWWNIGFLFILVLVLRYVMDVDRFHVLFDIFLLLMVFLLDMFSGLEILHHRTQYDSDNNENLKAD